MRNTLLAGSALCLLLTAPASAGIFAGGMGGAETRAAPKLPMILAQAEADAPAENGDGECPPGTEPAEDGECVPIVPDDVPVEPEPVPEQAEQPEEAAPEPPAQAEEPEAEATGEAGTEMVPGDEVPVPEERPASEEALEEEAPAVEEAEEALKEAAPEEPAQPEAETAGEADAEMKTTQEDGAEERAPEPVPEGEGCPPGTMPAVDDGGCVVLDEDAPVDEQAEEAAPTEEKPKLDDAAADTEAETEADVEAESEAEMEATGEAEAEADAEAEAQTEAEAEGEVLPENAAPVLDSQKEAEAETEADADAEAEAGTEETEPEQAAEQAPMPESDEQAQQDLVESETMEADIRSIVEDVGEPIDLGQTPEDMEVRRGELFATHEESRVVEQYNDNRIIVQINNNYYVRSPDYDRLVRRDDRVYYEYLSDGRVREVIERPDGTLVITVRNRYGDVLRRVRVTPDGREYVLVYVPEDRYDRMDEFYDPAYDLPPLRLTISYGEYVLEAEPVMDADRYYTFLDQPPVEPVRRLYSLEEVKYSARVRDTVRRIDLDTIEFAFGSAAIEESEIAELDALANAILRLLDENPAETFLIEGHTDAVGSELANLALSDRRAESVAAALSNVFGVPPENLVTQGYGEQYLKIKTQERERQNRRVAVRRITPLVTPVASR